jgi:hypothetical protein
MNTYRFGRYKMKTADYWALPCFVLGRSLYAIQETGKGETRDKQKKKISISAIL